jgi:methionyl-tRNA synthetase
VMVSPFIPAKAQQLWEMLGMEGSVSDVSWSSAEDPAVQRRQIRRAEVLFPKPASV